MKVYAFIADGSEETECLAVVDVLRRGGADVTLVSVAGRREILSSHGVRIVADAVIEETDLSDAEVLFLPGGMPGTRNLGLNAKLCRELSAAAEKGKRIAAICAAPSLLGRLGLLAGRTATCFPGFETELLGATHTNRGVVTDGNITTARGLGYALDLGLELLALHTGKENALKVKNAIQYDQI